MTVNAKLAGNSPLPGKTRSYLGLGHSVGIKFMPTTVWQLYRWVKLCRLIKDAIL